MPAALSTSCCAASMHVYCGRHSHAHMLLPRIVRTSVSHTPGVQVKTLIGYGSPNKANTHGVHGAPLGSDETGATREQLKWDHGEFEIPPSVYDLFKEGSDKGARKEAEWNKALEEYTQKYPKARALLLCCAMMNACSAPRLLGSSCGLQQSAETAGWHLSAILVHAQMKYTAGNSQLQPSPSCTCQCPASMRSLTGYSNSLPPSRRAQAY